MTKSLGEARARVMESTVPTWQQPAAGYGDPREVIAISPLVGLPVQVAWARSSDVALEIVRLRGWATAVFAAASALVDVSESMRDSVDPALLRRALSSPADVRTHRWSWCGWDPSARRPRAVPEGSGWSDTWQVPVAETAGPGLGRIVPLLRQQIANGSGSWTCGEGSPRDASTVRDGEGVRLAQLMRAEDAAYCIAAREAVAQCGGLIDAVTALVDVHPTAPIASDVYLSAVRAARPWSRLPGSAAQPTEGRR